MYNSGYKTWISKGYSSKILRIQAFRGKTTVGMWSLVSKVTVIDPESCSYGYRALAFKVIRAVIAQGARTYPENSHSHFMEMTSMLFTFMTPVQ